MFLAPAVILMSAAVFVPGEGLILYRAIAFVTGLVLLCTALPRILFRVRMAPDGILITGQPVIPWTAITGCQCLAVNRYLPGRGFRIEYQHPGGGIGSAYVPRSLARHGEAFQMFLEMTIRHGSPWSFAEGIRKIKGIPEDQSRSAHCWIGSERKPRPCLSRPFGSTPPAYGERPSGSADPARRSPSDPRRRVVDPDSRLAYHSRVEQVMDKALVDSVLRLKPAERMRLLNVIYRSLEQPDTAIDEVWYDEAERRLAAHEAGSVQGVPAEQVLGKRP